MTSQTRAAGMIDARQLYAALGDIALDPEPDYRTRLLAHESLEALAAVWGVMALSFQPILRLYRRSPMWGVALPFIALIYLGTQISDKLSVIGDAL